jgi:hypothetical protein
MSLIAKSPVPSRLCDHTIDGQGCFFEQLNGSPRSFLGFCYGGNRIAGAQHRRMQKGAEIPQGKSLKKIRG